MVFFKSVISKRECEFLPHIVKPLCAFTHGVFLIERSREREVDDVENIFVVFIFVWLQKIIAIFNGH